MGYYDELLHIKWIRKRKKILQRDGWACTVCGSKKRLVVHHTFYRQGKKAWEYPNKSLITLCYDCHHKYHCEHETPVYGRKKQKIKTTTSVKKKKRITPLVKVQAEMGTRYRKKINGEWYYFSNTEQKTQIEKL